MKTEIYKSSTLRCVISSKQYKYSRKDPLIDEIEFLNGEKVNVLDFQIEGKAYIVWPNREGEGFNLNAVSSLLNTYGCSECGLSISYPATASMTAFLVKQEKGEGFLFYMNNDRAGKIRDIRIFSSQIDQITIRVTAIHKKWKVIKYNRKNSLKDSLPNLMKSNNFLKKQIQLGLIGPDGHHHIPGDLGFDIIYEVAEKYKSDFGSDNTIIHLFGYNRGHDRMYPDYSPSPDLGSLDDFKRVLKKTKSLGFQISMYLNGRIIDRQALPLFPHLKDSILLDNQGEYIKEIYQNRTFYVMDPSSQSWQDCLIQWAMTFSEFGADAVQLDQLGGRAAVKKTGEIWGSGYNRIIEEIHKSGMKVWIQGISDFYKADWFEMTYRNVKIMNGGILRGGTPLGHTDLSLVDLFLNNKTFLITPSKLLKIENRDSYDFIEDFPDFRGELPIYSENYLNMLINAEAALR
jgi:hypothetical protein